MASSGLGIDINEIIKSAYNTVMELQQAATETVGTDCLWARATPVINSEDVVLQEYTLTQVGLECPQKLRAIVSNSDYNPGEYTIDLYGLNYVQPLELNITIQNWNTCFGSATMPQKGDIVYVQIYNKLFEVQSSELIYTLAALPTYYKVVLSKYSPTASRRETQEFRESVEELTTSQEDLFGDIISQEVADNDIVVETGYNNTTYVDPNKDFDIDSIISNQIYGSECNLISNAYYDFNNATKNVTYNETLIYEISSERNHLIYSCWLKTNVSDILYGKIKAFVLQSKDSHNWYFRIATTLKLKEGDSVTITRGTLLKITGTIVDLGECENNTLGVAIKTSDIIKANKKLTNWYNTPSVLKIYKTIPSINLLRGYDSNDKIIFDINYKNNNIVLQINDKSKIFNIDTDLTDWNYFMFDISPEETRLVINSIKQNELNKLIDVIKVDKTIKFDLTDFNIETFRIENMGNDVQMCNIRLYENEYAIEDRYCLDMYSSVTRNASKLIFVDSPNVPNKDIFISPVK